MAGNTNHYSLPYPTAGDPIYLGASQIQSAMDAVDAALWTAGIPAVAQTNPPRCQARRSTAQSVPNAADTLLTYPTRMYDSEAVRVPASPMFVAGGSTITIRVAGVYTVSSVIYKAAVGGVWNQRILYNGTSYLNSLMEQALAGSDMCSQLTGTFQFGVGDVLRVAVWQNSGGSVNFGPGASGAAADTRFSVTYLGAFTA